MSTDVLSARATATGQLLPTTSRVRVRGVHILGGATAGNIVFRTNGAGGTTLLTLDSGVNTSTYMLLPSHGQLFEQGVHLTFTNAAAVTVFYA